MTSLVSKPWLIFVITILVSNVLSSSGVLDHDPVNQEVPVLEAESSDDDRTSFSAFNRLVTDLKQHALDVELYRQTLNEMRQNGILDENYEVIKIPGDFKELMENIG